MRIWFNRGFSLAPIARAMMAADPALEVIVSTAEGKPIYEGPSQTWVEPKAKGVDYLAWACRQIIDHEIDVFVPTARRHLFAGGGLPCRVHLPADLDTLELLEDKFLFSEALKNEPYHLATFTAHSAADLARIVERFRATNDNVDPCVKPREGVNGQGFWTLTKANPLSHLMDPDARRIRQDIYLDALRAAEATAEIEPQVVMPFLPGPEVSFDILSHEGLALKYIARTKNGTRQRLQSSHPLENDAKSLVSRFQLHGVVNIQFRKASDDSWKVLEINARPAGGSVYAEQFGSALLAEWGGLLTGRLTPDMVSKPNIDLEVEIETSVRPRTRELAA